MVAKLFDEGNESYLADGVSLNTGTIQLPLGNYYIREWAQWPFPVHISRADDNFIKANDVSFLKFVLPFRAQMTINNGQMPDFPLSGSWTLILDKGHQAVSPRAYAIYRKAISPEEWAALTKPKSKINIDDLDYKPLVAGAR